MEIEFKNINGYDENCLNAKLILEILNKIEFSFNKDSAKFRKIFKEDLKKNGFSVDVKLDVVHKISITSLKNDTAVCLQTGNIARYGYDLVKLLYLNSMKKNFKAIYICPLYSTGNKAAFERISGEIENLFSNFINFPIKIIGIDN